MKRPPQAVPLRKGMSILAAGMVCGFCAVAAFLTFSEGHVLTPRVFAFAAGALLASVVAIAINRYL